MNIYKNLSKKCKRLARDFKSGATKHTKDCNIGDVVINIENEMELAEELALYLATKRKKRFIYFLTRRELKLPLPVDSEDGIGWDFNVAFTDSPDLIFGDDVVCIVDGESDFTKEQIDSIQISKIFVFGSKDGYDKYCNAGILNTAWYKFIETHHKNEGTESQLLSCVYPDRLHNIIGGI